MDGPRVPLLVGALLAGLAVGGAPVASAGLLDPITTTVNGVVTTVTQAVTDITTATTATDGLPTTTDITVPTSTDVTVPTVPLPPPPTDPIDTQSPLPDLPTGGGLPQVVAGTLDATSQVTTTASGDASGLPPLPGFTPSDPDLSPFGSVVGNTGGAGPEIRRLIVPDSPKTGQPVSFTIAAQDANQPMSGVSFDFGEGGSRFGESACRKVRPSRRATFSVPYRFSVPGPHVVRFELTSGSCGSASRVTAGQVTVNVARGDAQVRAITGPVAGVLTTQCPDSDVLPTGANRTQVRMATLCLLNSVRRKANLRTLRSLRSLRRIAAQQSRDMVTHRYFDHTSPTGRTLVTRLRTIHWQGPAGENIGYGTAYYATARAMMWAWMHSSGHRTNILDRGYRWIGVAISLGAPTSNSRFGATYTTDFGGR